MSLTWILSSVLYLSSYMAQNITLREAAEKRGIYIGSCANNVHFDKDASYAHILADQFSIVYPEYECLFNMVEPMQNVFNFTLCDKVLNYSIANNQLFAADHLIWGTAGNPDWLLKGNFTPSQKKDILVNHITKVMQYYGNKTYSWNVVNEAISDFPDIEGTTFKHNVWYPDVPDYVDIAFQTARNINPNVKLFYNDYLDTELTPKSEAVYEMLKSMVNRGIPIDGMGFETHVSLLQPLIYESVYLELKRIADLGLTVHISEMDVACGIPTYLKENGSYVPCIDWNEKKMEKQAEYYSIVLQACLDIDGCISFTSWGFTDKYTWIDTDMHPLEWDENYNKKPAFDAMLNVLLNNTNIDFQ